MHEFDFAHYLLEMYRAEIDDRKDLLASGGASSMENYKKVVGEISGYSQAIDHIKTLLDKLEKANG